MLRVYRALLLAGLQQATQYRVQSLLWMLFAIIRPVIFLAAWVAVAVAQGGSVAGYAVPDFAAYYVCLTLVAHLTMAWNSHEFEWEIRMGRLSPKLLRPLHPLHYAVTENLVFKLNTLPFLLLVLVGISVTFGARYATQPWHVAAFVPSVILAWALSFLFGWVIATLAFWATRMRTANTLAQRAAFVFSGQIAPIALMPDWLQAISYALPFWYMLGTPTEILIGRLSPAQAAIAMAGQVVWLALTYAGFRYAWGRGMNAYTAVGA